MVRRASLYIGDDMKIFVLWDEDSHIAKLCLSKESAISFIKGFNETDHVTEHRYKDTKSESGGWLYDLELEAGGARYRLEEMEAE